MTWKLDEQEVRRALRVTNIPPYMHAAVIELMLGRTPDGKTHTPWTAACTHHVDETELQECHSRVLDETDRRWREAGRPHA